MECSKCHKGKFKRIDLTKYELIQFRKNRYLVTFKRELEIREIAEQYFN
jgi:hypothetical protein